jgi:hypothetical protein
LSIIIESDGTFYTSNGITYIWVITYLVVTQRDFLWILAKIYCDLVPNFLGRSGRLLSQLLRPSIEARNQANRKAAPLPMRSFRQMDRGGV